MNDSERDQLLGRLDERTEVILKRLESGDNCLKDHERRIGRLESFQATLIGIAGFVSFVVSLIWTKIGTFFQGGN
jgi:hypothetical protein